MKEKQYQFLRLLGQIPARLTAGQTAWVLNCQPHDIPVLVAAHLLKPLCNPRPNSVKYFAVMEVFEVTKDRTWLAKNDDFFESVLAEKKRCKESRVEFASGIILDPDL